jgi:Tic22-like family
MKHLGLGLALTSMVVFAPVPTQALPDTQVVEKLQKIPVLILTDKSGAPLVMPSNGDPQKGSYTEVYLGQKEMKTALQKIQTNNPAIAKQLQIRVVALGDVYRNQVTNNGTNKLNVLVVPSEAQVKIALNLARKTDPKIKQFDGVPLFVGMAGKPKGFMTTNSVEEKKRVIPMFFERDQLQVVLDQFKKDQPSLAPTVEIKVITLDGLLTQMRARNEPIYNQIAIASPSEITDYIQPPATPTTAPTKPVQTKPARKPVKKKPRVNN